MTYMGLKSSRLPYLNIVGRIKISDTKFNAFCIKTKFPFTFAYNSNYAVRRKPNK